MSILQIENVSKTYGKGTGSTKALKGINLEVKAGSFNTIIGRSGSGKSTLLHIAGGLDSPDEGNVLLEGTSIFSLKDKKRTILRRKRIGFVFQSYNLIPEFTVLENICLPSYLNSNHPSMEFVDEILDALELDHKKNSYPQELSGGEQQRTAIARAISTKPAIILADEPTGNLDIKSGEQVLELLQYCHRKFNQTTLLVTHDLEIARRSERIITLEDGEIVSDYIGEPL